MTHVRTLALDPAADPIHAAIERHRVACDAHRAGPTLFTSDDLDAASDTLVATPCATRFGALALLAHLRAWLLEEAEFAAGHQPSYRLAQARVADLTLFLGTNLPPVAIPRAFPSGRKPAARPPRLLPGVDRCGLSSVLAPPNEALPGEGAPWEAVAAIRPDTAFVRAPRFLDVAGEALAALVLIAGGCVVTGLATLL